ncbi:hypothetical protein KIN20_013694 [Parelaphostrongylus tenuis]|uniref:Uncharacterized protein n=1 Tax=Parelaphostrongylus tenuis TaxID=148309 RepID=A0AAD5MCH9_PARTN|nr:hypothetical protein KIN20_013694 [Parelaphostrongylus tenuis]
MDLSSTHHADASAEYEMLKSFDGAICASIPLLHGLTDFCMWNNANWPRCR